MRHALSGLRVLFAAERNARFEGIMGVLAVIAGIILHLDWVRWCVLLALCCLVLATEAINTAIERAVDLTVGHELHPLAKQAKDIAAAAVLFIALLAVIVAVWLFGPALAKIFF
ncbi:diacylglycerol kinase family protein [Lacticaseibacillus pabuli]|uniref:Diacylglycerol kinase family protein n=1 Tax=Lacticaseibacillus pabuli TaxID=3025672 RepID=A0ABY7WUD6_9LACO|nr:diacylglycerol kinase family protein [Lacticaseibacillus sp. KACC 23028]WDF83787.1 diacylglycerol kinase family protein [Lacticaseibacillus sp. KACC 23028]